MKIEHLTSMDFGGAGIAARRSVEALRKAGMDASLLCLLKRGEDPWVRRIPDTASRSLSDADPSPGVQGVAAWETAARRWRHLASRHPGRPAGVEIFTDAASEVRLECVRDFREAEILHLHWAAGMLDFGRSSSAFRGKTVFWTLHDMNPFTGGCHYAGACRRYMTGCGRCPQLGSSSDDDLSQKIFRLKEGFIRGTDLHVLAPSRWLADRARESALLEGVPVSVVPNAVPSDTFRPGQRERVRDALGIPEGDRVILFGADSVETVRKGYSCLLEAMRRLPREIGGGRVALATFGGGKSEPPPGFDGPFYNLGSLSGDAQVALAYSAADLFALPSLEDNLPNTVLEAMSSGVPVAAFDVGGVPDMVVPGETGFLAAPRDVDALVDAMRRALEANRDGAMSARCREKVVGEFSPEVHARRLSTLYREASEAATERRGRRRNAHRSKFSIVTPSFNQGAYIEKTILSVLAQDYPDVEHLVFDGGSTDGTVGILERYPHLRWVSEKDRGQSDALNKGFGAVSGDICAWINSDDWYEPGAFHAVADFFEENPDKNVVMGDCVLIDGTGKTFDVVVNSERDFEEISRYWVYRSIPAQPAVFFRRRLLEEHGLLDEDLHFAMDYDLWMRFARKERFPHIPVLLAGYLFHEAAKGGDQDWNKFLPDCDRVYRKYGHHPRVSVVIPCYNYGRYLEGAVLSVIEQSCRSFEILIVDDGSTDDTAQVAHRLIDANPGVEIRLLTQPNSGDPARPRNRGVEEARGEYILCLDPDDYYARDMIADCSRVLDADPWAGIAYPDQLHFGAEGNVVPPIPDHDLSVYSRWNYITGTSMFRKTAWEDAGGYVAGLGYEDWDFWLSVCERGWGAVHVPRILFMYRVHEGSRFKTQSRRDDEMRAEVYLRHPALYDADTLAAARSTLSARDSRPEKARMGDRPPKVLFLVHNFPPHWFAGVELYSFNLAREIASTGAEVTVCFPWDDKEGGRPRLVEEGYAGLRTVRLVRPSPATHMASLSDPEVEEQLLRLARETGADVVHVQHLKGFPFSVVRRLKEAGFPVTVSLHDGWYLCHRIHLFILERLEVCTGPESPEKCASCMLAGSPVAGDPAVLRAVTDFTRLRREFAKEALAEADRVVSPSGFMKELHERYGFGAGRIELSPLGLQPVRASLDLAPSGPARFLFLGTVHPIKAPYDLVGAFRSLGGNARLTIRGNGTDENIARLVSAIGGDPRIAYSGAYTPEGLPDLLAEADVVVVPSRTENYPTVVREALCAGLPVLAAKVGGIPEIVTPSVDGFLYDPSDPDALRGWLRRISDDPSIARRLRGHGWQPKTMAQDAAEWLARYRDRSEAHPLTCAVYSLDQPGSACDEIRIRGPLERDPARFDVIRGIRFEEDGIKAVPVDLEDVDLILIQRFFPFDGSMPLLEAAFRSGKRVVFETDDLLTALPEGNPHKAWADERSPRILETIRRADTVVVSTEELGRAYAPYNDRIVVLPNLLDERIWSADPVFSRDGGPVIVGYSGTATHLRDLKVVEEALFEIARRNPGEVVFHFMGFASERMKALPGFRFIPFDPSYRGYARTLMANRFDVAVVPLEDNPFNRCKSHIKWLEYGICGTPGVYSNLPGYAGVVRQGETGFLAGDDPLEWVEAIEALVRDKALRQGIGERVRAEVLSRHTLAAGGAKRIDAYREIVRREDPMSPDRRKLVSVVVPIFNNLDYTKGCIEALAANSGDAVPWELILVDNGSTDGTADFLLGLSGDVTLVRNPSNLGFAVACNQGAALARGEHIVFLNNDTVPGNGWLEALVMGAEAEGAAIAGAKLLYPDGRVQHAGVAFGEEGIGYHIFCGLKADAPAVNRRRFLKAVTAACMLVKSEVFRDLGGFDEGYRNGFEDVDFCLRAGGKGHRILFVPEAVLIHHEEKTRGRKDRDRENMTRFLARWGGRIAADDQEIYAEEGFRKTVTPEGRILLSPVPVAKGSLAAEIGDALAREGKYEDADRRYREALAVNAEDVRALAGLGILALVSGDAATAVRLFEAALRADGGGDAASLCGMGLAVGAVGDATDAFDWFLKALDADPSNAVAIHELTKGAFSLGRYSEAEVRLRKFLDFDPSNAHMLYSLAAVCHKQGRRSEALDALDRLAFFDPSYDGAEALREQVVADA